MEPLDLEARPPRSPREQMLGVYFLPRTIDKMRAELPGGKLGTYFVEGPVSMSGYMLHKLKIVPDELRAVVARASDESEVESWLRERIDPALVEPLNAKLAGSRIDAGTPETQAMVREKHPVLAERPDIEDAFALLEADDAWCLARR